MTFSHPTNSVKALKENQYTDSNKQTSATSLILSFVHLQVHYSVRLGVVRAAGADNRWQGPADL